LEEPPAIAIPVDESESTNIPVIEMEHGLLGELNRIDIPLDETESIIIPASESEKLEKNQPMVDCIEKTGLQPDLEDVGSVKESIALCNDRMIISLNSVDTQFFEEKEEWGRSVSARTVAVQTDVVLPQKDEIIHISSEPLYSEEDIGLADIATEAILLE
jgi:hypothetical protein